MAVSQVLFGLVSTIWSTMEPYRLSYIGWTPSQQSIYHSIMGAISIPTNQWLTQPLLRRLGNRFSCALALSACQT